MLLAFSFILLAIGIGILVSVYSIFFPFIKNLGEIGNYNTAYYGAISSVERAELTLKYREPGFEGSGGYIGTGDRGPISDYETGAFGFINNDLNGMRRVLSSRTKQVPNAGEGNIEYLVANASSSNYNMLDYAAAEKIILSYDQTTDTSKYYTGGENVMYYNGGTITGALRLPPKVYSGFGGGTNALLCTNNISCDLDGDGLGDDIVTDRSLEGYQNGMYFKIIPYVGTLYYSGAIVDQNKDTAIRESLINVTGDLYFGQTHPNEFNPINNYHTNNLTGHIVIANTPNNINTLPFSTILGDNSTYTGMILNFGLINLLTTSNGNIYPFLEYQLNFTSPVADRFYTIQGNGRVGDYDVQIVVKKPTSQGSIAGSFTVIF